MAQLFIPVLMRDIDLAEDHWVKVYLQPFVALYTDMEAVRRMVMEEILDRLPELESKALELTVLNAESTRNIMRITLRNVGKRPFERIFSMSRPPSRHISPNTRAAVLRQWREGYRMKKTEVTVELLEKHDPREWLSPSALRRSRQRAGYRYLLSRNGYQEERTITEGADGRWKFRGWRTSQSYATRDEALDAAVNDFLRSIKEHRQSG